MIIFIVNFNPENTFALNISESCARWKRKIFEISNPKCWKLALDFFCAETPRSRNFHARDRKQSRVRIGVLTTVQSRLIIRLFGSETRTNFFTQFCFRQPRTRVYIACAYVARREMNVRTRLACSACARLDFYRSRIERNRVCARGRKRE